MSPATMPHDQFDAQASVRVDRDVCVGCGECLRVCPRQCFSLVEGKAAVTGPRTILCGHCEAVCPVGAIRVLPLDTAINSFETFTPNTAWLAPGRSDPGELARLLASRRSVRNFRAEPVPRPMLDDLVRFAVTAPSGTNCQAWTFTILPERSGVLALGGRVAAFFERLNAQAANVWLREGLALLGKPELRDYHRSYAARIAEGLRAWRAEDKDMLFHGATAAVLIGSRPGASTPAEDGLLAAQNLMLGAHSLGLGTCLIGYATAAMRRDPGIKTFLGVPAEEQVHAVAAVGWPDERYTRTSRRLEPVVRTFTSS